MTKQSIELENLFLYGFMKDNQGWRTSFDPISKCTTYHNPLNSTVYGLLFAKEQRWVDAVRDKINEHFIANNYLCDWSLEKVEDGFCGMLLITENEIDVIQVAHAHGKTEFFTEYKLVIQAVEYIVAKNN